MSFRKALWMKTTMEALFFAILAIYGYKDMLPSQRMIYFFFCAIAVYNRFPRKGLFSIFDLFGMVSNLTLPTNSNSRPRIHIHRSDPDLEKKPVEKIGVVFAGGGGKGAYHVGCWKALMRRGIKIDAVSGTSVGAFNIALIASGGVPLAENVWKHLSASQIMRLNKAALPMIFLYLDRWRRRYAGDFSIWRAMSLVMTLLLIGMFSFFLWQVFPFTLAFKEREKPVYYYILLVMASTVCLLNLANLTLKVLPMIAGISYPVMGGIFGTNPLRRLLKALVPPGTFIRSAVRYYVTIGREVVLFNRRDNRHYVWKRKWFIWGEKYLARMRPRIAYLPSYVDLARVEREDSIDSARWILKLSGALPYIFQNVRIDNDWYFDGGVADNIPIQPLLDHGCTRIFVIHLQSSGEELVDGRRCKLLQRRGVLRKLKRVAFVEELWRFYQSVYKEHFEKRDYQAIASDSLFALVEWPRHIKLTAELIHVVPSLNLGSFLTGTLNFTGRKANWLMSLGERDMDYILNHIPKPAEGSN